MASKDLEYYMSQPYRIIIEEDVIDGGYVAQCPELRGCVTSGETISEALEMLEDAKREWLSACLDDSIPIPEPQKLDSYSGQFKLRMPKSLHQKLAKRSIEEGVSMNQYCVYLLSKALDNYA